MKLKSFFPVYLAILLAIPGAMIYSHEKILKQGEVFMFKTRPVDPYDLFRGRYVVLAFEQDSFEYNGPEHYPNNTVVYLTLGRDKKGFTKIESFSTEKPKSGTYLRAHVSWHEKTRWIYSEKTKTSEAVSANTVRFHFPFSRFYMNERKAPKAEALYRDVNSPDPKKPQIVMAAQVRVLNGSGILENVLVDGQPLAEKTK
ncbi:MAG TPA: hypothetical protein DIS66_06490 [Candidatus Omnitrophica bacterium]|nr:hypothetical protein [Candidatus Omnitrophota bacterium]